MAQFYALVYPDIEGVFILDVSQIRDVMMGEGKRRAEYRFSKSCDIVEKDGLIRCEKHGSCGADYLEVIPLELDPSIAPDFVELEMKRLLSKRNQWVVSEFEKTILDLWKRYQAFTMPELSKYEQWCLVQNAK